MGRILTPALLAQRLHSAQDAWEQPPSYPGDEDAPDVDAFADEVIALIGRACRAHPMDANACADLLREASQMLVSLADEVSQ